MTPNKCSFPLGIVSRACPTTSFRSPIFVIPAEAGIQCFRCIERFSCFPLRGFVGVSEQALSRVLEFVPFLPTPLVLFCLIWIKKTPF